MLTLSGCKDDTPIADITDPETRSALSFSLEDKSETSRVSYGGLTSVFEDGDLIGCIIASHTGGSYEYLANSCWQYKKENQFLYLKKLLDPQNNPIGDDENNIIKDNPEKGAPYLTLLNQDIQYVFFFYYPYVDKDILTNSLSDALELENGSYIINFGAYNFPNTKEGTDNLKTYTYTSDINSVLNQSVKHLNGAMLTKPVSSMKIDGDDSNLSTWSWLEYPIAVMKNQHSNNGKYSRLNNSDFMYVKIETAQNKPITTATTKFTVPVELVKQMSTIEIEFDPNIPEPANVYLQGGVYKNQYGSSETKKLFCAKSFDFTTGKFETFNLPDNWWSRTDFQKAVDTDKPITPHFMGGHKYRIILPPMSKDEFICDLKFTIEGTEKTVHINDNPRMNHIDGNTYYLIKITKLPDNSWDVIINDWRPGGSQDLVRPDW